MWFPVVGYRFDVRNCTDCDYFKPIRSSGAPPSASPNVNGYVARATFCSKMAPRPATSSATSIATLSSPSVANRCNPSKLTRNPPMLSGIFGSTYRISHILPVAQNLIIDGVE